MICPRRSRAKNNDGKKFNCDYYCGVTEADGSNERGFCKLRDEFYCIERIVAGIPRLSYSSISDWVVCKRLYFLKHIKGIRALDAAMSIPVKKGALWDLCIQVLVGDSDKKEIGKLISRYEIQPRDVAKVKALYRAWKELEINIDTICKTQARFELPMTYEIGNFVGDFVTTGVFDRLYDDWFAETKLSGSPDWYTQLYNLIPQVGTYFLADPNLRYCKMEITRCPDLKSIKSFKDESVQAFEERCFNDILSRPSFYFLGYDKASGTFGKKFYRTEFPLEEIKQRYSSIYYEITEAANRDGVYGAFWKNWTSCLNHFGPCEFIDVCHHDKVSEAIFTMRDKPKEVGVEITEAERQLAIRNVVNEIQEAPESEAISPDEIDGLPF